MAAGFACEKIPPKTGHVAVRSIAGPNSGLAEPFGVAYKDGSIFFSDGEQRRVFAISKTGIVEEINGVFDTPSGIAFGPDGVLYIADAGRNAIYKLDGSPTLVAGIEGQRGSADGDALSATFNGPVGIAIDGEGAIFVSDTYNDRIRVIRDGRVTTLAGGERGFSDGVSPRFDTPLGIAFWNERIVVADAGNRRIRAVEKDGSAWTLAGSGEAEMKDGLPSTASFVRPTSVAVSPEGAIYIADGHSIRAIGRRSFAFVETLSSRQRGFRDGAPYASRFNRPSGIAVDGDGRIVVADSDNGLVRRFEFGSEPRDNETILPERPVAEDFRQLQPPRWPYDPPDAKREIAGTLGEIRGEIVDASSRVWFHNGLDITGAYGETARFVRSEKVLDPIPAENFGTLRELIRMPTIGYIHIRLGRDAADRPFGDQRFIFSNGPDGKPNGVRVPRGAKFSAGEAIGTLNAMNHVHLIAGPTGNEMNALASLTLPGVADSISPVIERVTLFDENWRQIETGAAGGRITLTGRSRIVVRAYDRMDGNSEARRLGVYKLGYELIGPDGGSLGGPKWTIMFDRNPPPEAVATVYAVGSRSGATGGTVLNYIVTNRLDASGYNEDFLDPASLAPGMYSVRVSAADLNGNQTYKDIQIEVKR